MSRHCLALLGLALLAGLACGGTALAQQPEAAELPISRVVLFTSGVGYFERTGTVPGGSSIQMLFKTEDINDILKSLVVTGAQQASVSYAPRDPVSKALESFSVDIADDPTLGQLLGQLRGAEVRVDVPPRTLAGTILGVEQRTVRLDDDQTLVTSVLNILADGSLHSIDLTQVRGIHLVDAALQKELTRALGVLAGARDRNKKPVTINVGGDGRQQVGVGYIVETPVWKTSYRLVLQDDEKPLLQGWAIVENTSDADWSDVQLSLVSGQPISFVQDLYTPYYVDRPVVEPERYAMLKAQAYEGRLADKAYKKAFGLGEKAAADRAPMAPQAARAVGRRGGHRAAGGNATGGLFELDEVKKMATAAEGAGAVAELFEYPIAGRVTLERQQSAMFLIVNGQVEAERMSIFNSSVHEKFPLHGLEMTNSTGLYLMQGPITVFDEGVYAGDARINDVPVDDTRLLSYALDQKREVTVRRPSRDTELVSLKIVRGVLIASRRYEREAQYLVTNKAPEAHLVMIQHPYDAGWTVVEPKDVEPATASEYRFRVTVPGRKGDEPGGERLTVREQQMIDQRIAVASESPDTLRYYMRSNKASRDLVSALESVLQKKARIAEHEKSISRKQAEIKEITDDQARTRENMRVVGERSSMYDTYLKKWQEQEQRLETLRDEIKQLQETVDQLQKELNAEIARLSVN